MNTKALSLFMDTADITFKVDTADVSTFTNAWKAYIPGLIGGTVTLSGDYDPTITSGPASVLTGLLGAAPFAIVFYPAGNNAGQGTSHSASAILTDYKEAAKTTTAVTIAATLLLTGVDTIAQL